MYVYYMFIYVNEYIYIYTVYLFIYYIYNIYIYISIPNTIPKTLTEPNRATPPATAAAKAFPAGPCGLLLLFELGGPARRGVIGGRVWCLPILYLPTLQSFYSKYFPPSCSTDLSTG